MGGQWGGDGMGKGEQTEEARSQDLANGPLSNAKNAMKAYVNIHIPVRHENAMRQQHEMCGMRLTS
jgi:hypothetical protein